MAVWGGPEFHRRHGFPYRGYVVPPNLHLVSTLYTAPRYTLPHAGGWMFIPPAGAGRWWDGMILGAYLGPGGPVDVSPYRRPLRLINPNGAINRVPGPQGSALEFAGVDNVSDRLTLGSIPAADPLSLSQGQEYTIVSLVYIPSSWHVLNTYPRLIDKSDGASGANGWFIYTEAGASYDDVQFCCGNSTGHGAKFTGYQGQWSTWCWRIDDTTGGDSTRIWINGLEQTVIEHATINLPAPTTTTNAAIGNWNHTTDRLWEGAIGVVWIWDRLLDPHECRAITLDPWLPIRGALQVPATAAAGATPISGVVVTAFNDIV